jgi:hypothetical protein
MTIATVGQAHNRDGPRMQYRRSLLPVIYEPIQVTSCDLEVGLKGRLRPKRANKLRNERSFRCSSFGCCLLFLAVDVMNVRLLPKKEHPFILRLIDNQVFDFRRKSKSKGEYVRTNVELGRKQM